MAPLELGLIALWIAVGSARQRRSHFWIRISLAALALPALMAALVGLAHLSLLSDDAARLLFPGVLFFGVVALMLIPGLLYHGSDSSPGPSEPDGGGGPGPGPRPPSPQGPRGGIPLPDAEQASARARDHTAPSFDQPSRRRPEHEPGRVPARTRS